MLLLALIVATIAVRRRRYRMRAEAARAIHGAARLRSEKAPMTNITGTIDKAKRLAARVEKNAGARAGASGAALIALDREMEGFAHELAILAGVLRKAAALEENDGKPPGRLRRATLPEMSLANDYLQHRRARFGVPQ
jgi:hypothetical protein